MVEILDDVGHCVDAVLRRVGPRLVLALPLGIGKPNPLANEFYRRALRDPGIDLTIFTALSLLKPVAHGALERRLLEPLVERVFGSYVEPEYARALKADTLPPNVDLLLANILSAPLCALATSVAALVRPGGRLVLSGLMVHESPEVTAAYDAWFDIETCAAHDEWVVLCGARRAS